MPLYEYQCDACGHRFEVIQKFSDSPVETCRVCGGAVHKLQSAPAFQFKGSGWYVTDYARKDHGAGANSEGESKGSAEKTEKTEKKETAASESTSSPAPSAAAAKE